MNDSAYNNQDRERKIKQHEYADWEEIKNELENYFKKIVKWYYWKKLKTKSMPNLKRECHVNKIYFGRLWTIKMIYMRFFIYFFIFWLKDKTYGVG